MLIDFNPEYTGEAHYQTAVAELVNRWEFKKAQNIYVNEGPHSEYIIQLLREFPQKNIYIQKLNSETITLDGADGGVYSIWDFKSLPKFDLMLLNSKAASSRSPYEIVLPRKRQKKIVDILEYFCKTNYSWKLGIVSEDKIEETFPVSLAGRVVKDIQDLIIVPLRTS